MEWELSKENVLPKRNGRSVSQLESALQPQGDHQIQLRSKKHEFEEELRAYSGDDPLDVWYRYISWIEENYPKGGKKDLSSIMTSCMKAFCEEDKYKNDVRYVDIWIKFANLYDNPELMYEHMRDQGIGCECSAFYEAWANYLELLGNTIKADAIFAEGLKRKAQPYDGLQKRHQEFQNRTVLNMMKQPMPVEDSVARASDVERRVAFTGLEVKGKKKVPSVRPGQVGLVKTDVRVPLSGKVCQPQKISTLKIYNDENAPSSGTILPESSANEYQNIPVQSIANRENSKEPGIWTKNKIKSQKCFPVSQKAPFEVQKDGSSEIMTPKKNPEIDCQILSVRKPETSCSQQQHSNPMQQMFEPSSFQKPMYCKEKIYAGTEEYSFEELRCIRWRRKQEEKNMKAIEERNKRLMDEQEQIMLKNRELMLKHLKLMEEQKLLEEEIENQKQKRQQLKEKESAKNVSEVCVEKGHVFGDAANNSANRSKTLASTSLNSSNMKTPDYSRNSSLNNNSQTGSNSSLHNKKSGKKSSSAPSPTVNTIEALQVVRGLYSASINLGKDSTIDDDQDNNNLFEEFQEDLPKQPVASALSKAPFTICEDEPQAVQQQPQQKSNKSTGFQVFCDDAISSNLQQLNLQENKMSTATESMYRLPMPDMNEITLGFNSGVPEIQVKSMDNATIISEQPFNLKKLTSTPFHFASNACPQPDFANLSTISGSTCATTENTIMMEQLKPQCEISNKTNGLSPIKEGSTEATHSSLESCTLERSHPSTHHVTHLHSASVKVNSSVKVNVVHEPFSSDEKQKLLSSLTKSLQQLNNFHFIKQPVPSLRSDSDVSVGVWNGSIVKSIAKGGNGQIYQLAVESPFAIYQDIEFVALKVQKPACCWEFYVCNEIQKRLKILPSSEDMSLCYMSVHDGFFYQDGSILITRFFKDGTLLDFVNKHHHNPDYSLTCESLAVYVLIQLLTIVDQLHKCHIIHGDIKPDNIILRLKAPNYANLTSPEFLTLIDFGESIDLSLYPEGTVFTGKVLTTGFQCVEMKTNKPWTYQTDLYGVLGTIHVVLFGKYMNIFNNQGKWQTSSNFQRKWNVPLWKQLFHDFLNIPSCDKIPDLLAIRDKFIDYFPSSLMVDPRKTRPE